MNEKSLTPGSEETSAIELSEPHFDDTAIAIAQPVEPLSSSRPESSPIPAIVRRHLSLTVLLLILCGAVGFGTVAFGLAGLHRQLSGVDAQSTIVTEPPQNNEIVDTSNNAREKNLSVRPAVRKIKPRADADARPVARKVGEIR